MQHVRNGKARALAVTTPDRSPLAADVPIAREAGIQGFEITVWYGITAPRGTPQAVVACLERELLAVTQQADVRERMTGMGLEVTPMPAAAFGEFLRSEHAKWSELVRVSDSKTD